MFLITNFSYSQTNYTFKLSGVDSPSNSKEVIESLTKIFDKKPYFNDTTDTFTVTSEVSISQTKFYSKMNSLGYIVTSFNNTINIKEITE